MNTRKYDLQADLDNFEREANSNREQIDCDTVHPMVEDLISLYTEEAGPDSLSEVVQQAANCLKTEVLNSFEENITFAHSRTGEDRAVISVEDLEVLVLTAMSMALSILPRVDAEWAKRHGRA